MVHIQKKIDEYLEKLASGSTANANSTENAKKELLNGLSRDSSKRPSLKVLKTAVQYLAKEGITNANALKELEQEIKEQDRLLRVLTEYKNRCEAQGWFSKSNLDIRAADSKKEQLQGLARHAQCARWIGFFPVPGRNRTSQVLMAEGWLSRDSHFRN